MKNEVNKAMGQRIKQLRRQKNMTQTELAEAVGYSAVSTVCHIEKGDHDLTQSKIKKFAEVLGVSPTWLITGEDTSADRLNQITEYFISMDESKQLVLLQIAKNFAEGE